MAAGIGGYAAIGISDDTVALWRVHPGSGSSRRIRIFRYAAVCVLHAFKRLIHLRHRFVGSFSGRGIVYSLKHLTQSIRFR